MMTKAGSGALVAVVVLFAAGAGAARAAEGNVHQIYITTSGPSEGVRWYVQYLKCEAIPERTDTAKCGPVELVFVPQPTMGSTQGTGINHISFSFPDLKAKLTEFEKAGVRGLGVRFQRFPDGATFHDVAGLFKLGFIFDPWGTRIELVEDPEHLGFHHVHLSATDPTATLAWYRKMFGGKPGRLKGQVDGLQFDGGVWVLASRQEEGKPASTERRAIDHVAFVVKEFDKTAADLRKQGVAFVKEPSPGRGGANAPKWALVAGPDNVRVAVVETGFTGPAVERAPGAAVAADRPRGPYTTSKTPWGEPELQGIYTGNSASGIPLERPKDLAQTPTLTPEQAKARQERRTLSGIWGYEREWRDIVLDYVKTAPSTQVAMVIDPPDGRMPPLTPEGQKRAEAARRAAASEEGNANPGYGLPAGPEDLSPYVRCITRGLPGMMMPIGYNNGLQITQAPGYITLTKEMIHETRVIPTRPRERPGAALTSWLGDSQGRWEGDTLVVETTNFNGGAPFQGASANMKLIERITRVAPNALEYRFTIEDPTTWTKPWTAMFTFDRDDEQYELVEYSCHEGNYGIRNILSGARAREKQLQSTPQK
ncbi:MAG TPA: VOC family protein [Vicinamibacterales bacterium]|nr:VOC family protein [Vicinamibacterales bacterium]